MDQSDRGITDRDMLQSWEKWGLVSTDWNEERPVNAMEKGLWAYSTYAGPTCKGGFIDEDRGEATGPGAQGDRTG